MARIDLFLEKKARERQFEIDYDMRLAQETSLMVDDGGMSPRKMAVEGVERG